VLSFISLIAVISFYSVLIIGLVLSKKYAFRAGFYFFLLLFLLELSTLLLSPLFTIYSEKLHAGQLEVPFNMSIGELFAFRSYISLLIKAVAFLILVVGIHNKWKPVCEAKVNV
jgi:hypothetical protein